MARLNIPVAYTIMALGSRRVLDVLDADEVRLLVERFLSIRSAWQGIQGPYGCIYYLGNVTGIPLLRRARPGADGSLTHDIVIQSRWL